MKFNTHVLELIYIGEKCENDPNQETLELGDFNKKSKIFFGY